MWGRKGSVLRASLELGFDWTPRGPPLSLEIMQRRSPGQATALPSTGKQATPTNLPSQIPSFQLLSCQCRSTLDPTHRSPLSTLPNPLLTGHFLAGHSLHRLQDHTHTSISVSLPGLGCLPVDPYYLSHTLTTLSPPLPLRLSAFVLAANTHHPIFSPMPAAALSSCIHPTTTNCYNS